VSASPPVHELSTAAICALRALGDAHTEHVHFTRTGALVTDRGEHLLAPSDPLRFLFFGAAALRAGARLRPELDRVYRTIARGDTGPFALPEAPLALTGGTRLAGALRDMTRSVLAWRAAGDDVEPAALEVIADAYRQVSRP
jgi:hypothetical protein